MRLEPSTPCQLCLPLDAQALGRIMPLYLWIWPDGLICGAGPTLNKVLPDGLLGRPFAELFTLHRPREIASLEGIAQRAENRLKLSLRAAPHTPFKGMVVPLRCGQGMLLNLSFGIAVAEAVREHHLTDADFAPTDLAVEMLYLMEAKTAVMEELRSLNRRLREAKLAAEAQAVTDALTGLGNRRALDIALTATIRRGIPFGVMRIDLDFFKQVNDTLGHAAGDHVLTRVADILTSEIRSGDTVARVGGDEFVVLLAGMTCATLLEQIAARILARIEEPVPFGDRECRVSASIGATRSIQYDSPDAEQMLVDADGALYHSKRAGRRRVTLYEAPECSRAATCATAVP